MSTTTKSPKPAKEPKAAKGPKTPKASKGAKPRRAAESAEPAAVNLLSPWVLEELRVLRLRKKFLLGTLALLLVLGLLWTGLRLQLHRSEQEVRDEETVTIGLSSQMARLSDVRTYVTEVGKRSTTVGDVNAAQTRFSRAMAALDQALPGSARLDSLKVSLPVGTTGAEAETTTCPGPDPFGATDVDVFACMELTGTAGSRDDVSTFVQRLADVDLFLEPFVATTTKGTEDGVSFTGTVGITYAALTDPEAAADAAPGATDTEEGTG